MRPLFTTRPHGGPGKNYNMQIKFLIEEHIVSVLNAFIQGAKVEGGEQIFLMEEIGETDDDYPTWKYLISDIDGDGVATLYHTRYEEGGHSLRYVSASGKSTYEIGFSYQGDQPLVRYDGPFNGLLAQKLLPTMTPVNLEEAQVESSLHPYGGTMPMAKYRKVHAELQQLKSRWA